MYAFYVTKASTDAAGSVELRTDGGDAVEFLTVPAYSTLYMDAEGLRLTLKDLKRPLEIGAKVKLTMVTDGSIELTVNAEVRTKTGR